jgi:O-antigen chain-terminating methyltransferase
MALKKGFYSEFENRYRGSQELIRDRLAIYKNIARTCSGAVLDLGCGRGEWLSLLKEWNIAASGVDLDKEMVDSCIQRGLNVKYCDVLEGLKNYGNQSLGMITAFHLVEHVPFQFTFRLLEEIKRVLEPGGILIMETPNSENLIVSSNEFYIDPTHIRPVPLKLLHFTAEFMGFAECTILRLHGKTDKNKLNTASIFNAISNVSMDYAVIATSGKNDEVINILSKIKANLLELTLESSCMAYDKAINTRNTQLNQQIIDTNEKLNQQIIDTNEKLNQQIIDTNEKLNQQIIDTNEKIHKLWLHCVANSAEIAALKGSFSWKLTFPFRFVSRCLRKFVKLFIKRNKKGRLIFAANFTLKKIKKKISLDSLPPGLLYRDAQLLWEYKQENQKKP